MLLLRLYVPCTHQQHRGDDRRSPEGATVKSQLVEPSCFASLSHVRSLVWNNVSLGHRIWDLAQNKHLRGDRTPFADHALRSLPAALDRVRLTRNQRVVRLGLLVGRNHGGRCSRTARWRLLLLSDLPYTEPGRGVRNEARQTFSSVRHTTGRKAASA